jgi:hypothetical protein
VIFTAGDAVFNGVQTMQGQPRTPASARMLNL